MLRKAAFLLAVVPLLSAAQEPEWLVAPYIWASSVGWDLAARGDGTLSARDLHRFNDTWDVSVGADYGFGDTDGTLNLLGGVGWRSSGYFGLHLGYRHLAIEFDQDFDGEAATSDIELSGPFLGFMFRF